MAHEYCTGKIGIGEHTVGTGHTDTGVHGYGGTHTYWGILVLVNIGTRGHRYWGT